MKRLTYYHMKGSENDGWYIKPGVSREKAVYKLAHYENLEERGQLVKLPCKVGDDVFRIYDGKVYADWQIAYIEVYEDEIVLIDDSDNAIMYPADVGKTVFFSRREAEAALRKDGDTK